MTKQSLPEQTQEIDSGAPKLGRADYHDRRARRIERLQDGAESLRAKGTARLDAARRTASIIPFGQPILVGHHSEKRHRRDLARIHAGYDQGFAALKKADQLESRARRAEKNHAISSDDPEATARIKAKIARIESDVAKMKLANAIIRKSKGDRSKAIEGLTKAGFSQGLAEKLLVPHWGGRLGFEPYELANPNAEVRRLKARLAALESNAAQASTPDVQIGECTIREGENRTQLLFPGKPPEAIRAKLKAHGFRWSPREGAWQRHQSPDARYWAEYVAKAYAAGTV